MAEVRLERVQKAFGDVQVLRDIDLDVRDGEFMVFVGPSGCGKSTLLRTIAGLENITGGTMSIGGRVVNDVPPSERGIAPNRLAQFLGIGDHIADVIGNLIGCPQAIAQRSPRSRLGAPRHCSRDRRRLEQRAGLRTLIVGQP